VMSASVCLSVCLRAYAYLTNHTSKVFFPNFSHMLPAGVAQFFCGNIAVCYVLSASQVAIYVHAMFRRIGSTVKGVCKKWFTTVERRFAAL